MICNEALEKFSLLYNFWVSNILQNYYTFNVNFAVQIPSKEIWLFE